MLIVTYPPPIPPTLLWQVHMNSADTLQMNSVCIQKNTVAGQSLSKSTYIVVEVCFYQETNTLSLMSVSIQKQLNKKVPQVKKRKKYRHKILAGV